MCGLMPLCQPARSFLSGSAYTTSYFFARGFLSSWETSSRLPWLYPLEICFPIEVSVLKGSHQWHEEDIRCPLLSQARGTQFDAGGGKLNTHEGVGHPISLRQTIVLETYNKWKKNPYTSSRMFQETYEHRLGRLPKPTRSPVNMPPIPHIPKYSTDSQLPIHVSKRSNSCPHKFPEEPTKSRDFSQQPFTYSHAHAKRTIFRHLPLTGLCLQHQKHHHRCLNLPFCCLKSQFITRALPSLLPQIPSVHRLSSVRDSCN